MCKCSICGEILTSPVIIDNQIFGWSCAKKNYPNMSNPKSKWMEADNYFSETNERGIYIEAYLNGKKYIGFILFITDVNGIKKNRPNGINILNNKAYIDLLKYKK